MPSLPGESECRFAESEFEDSFVSLGARFYKAL